MLSELPEGWTLNPLAKILQPSLFIDGDWVESKDQSPDGDVRLIQLADIGDGHFIDKSDRHLTKDAAVRLKCTFLKKGDLLVARMPEPLGRCCVFPLDGEERFVTVVDVAVMRPHDNFNSIWLMNLVNSGYARKFIEDNAGGTTRKRISRKNLGGLPLPVPPLNEQHRIAEILSSVDASIQAIQAVIEQAERVKRGLVRERILGGLTPEEIFEGEAPENSELKTIAQATENLNKRRIPIKKSDRQGGEYPYYGATGVIDYVKDYIFDERILLISEDGANLVDRNYPIAYSVEGKTWVNNHAHVLKVDSPAQQKLIEEFFNEVPLTKFLTGMAQPKLNKAALGTIPVPVFSEAEAVVLAEAIAALDASIASNRASSEQLQTVKSGLMDDLLTGKVRTV